MVKKICDILKEKNSSDVTVSFEYFPPKTAKGCESVYNRVRLMGKAQPQFVDFTWGAGGGTSDLTFELSKNTQDRFNIPANMHITCTNIEREKIDNALRDCKEAGVCNLCALRGDPPQGETKWTATDTGFTCAMDLVKYIREQYGDFFCISVAGYPEGHPNVIGADGKCTPEDFKGEMEYLKKKIDAGANFIITQLFYDVDLFFSFVDECRKYGITVPILPGILPFQTWGGLQKIVGFCKTYIPPAIKAKVEEIKDDDAKMKAYGVEVCTEMCKKIIERGYTHLHFYTLNSETSTFAIMNNLGLKTSDEKSS